MILEESLSSVEEETRERVISLARNGDLILLTPNNDAHQGHKDIQWNVELRKIVLLLL
jgi:hypothetical protein